MSEPEVLTATAIGAPSDGDSKASGFGLRESLHAVATTSVAAASVHQVRPTLRPTRLLRLGVRGNVGAKTGPPSERPKPTCPERSLASPSARPRRNPLGRRDAAATVDS